MLKSNFNFQIPFQNPKTSMIFWKRKYTFVEMSNEYSYRTFGKTSFTIFIYNPVERCHPRVYCPAKMEQKIVKFWSYLPLMYRHYYVTTRRP